MLILLWPNQLELQEFYVVDNKIYLRNPWVRWLSTMQMGNQMRHQSTQLAFVMGRGQMLVFERSVTSCHGLRRAIQRRTRLDVMVNSRRWGRAKDAQR